MDASVNGKHLLDWEESDVHHWFSALGFAHYERQIRENNIQGDILCLLDAEELKSMGIISVGQRLSILKAIYDLKLVHSIPLGEDDYVPPSETTERISLEEIHSTVKDQGERLRVLEENNRTINNAMRSFLDEITKLRSSMGLPEEDKARKEISYPRSDVEAIGRAALGSNSPSSSDSHQGSPILPPISTSTTANAQAPYPTPRSTTTDVHDNTKVSLDDPTWKVLPAALKKHRIETEEWPNYAMLIAFGPPNNRTKRKLEHNEKPLYLFKKLKDAKKNPAFVLKNMKDSRSSKNDGPNSSLESLPESSNMSVTSLVQGYPTPTSSIP
ncbi:hypothetical protein BDN70DRAFT_608595 [Pholiota conissans]|uniref:SAM domain-containing protein n=1 Tax=Pholiota conissans TaxID=109636 RepID=A0A9P6D2C0_9AGAR|nr:hypothetical protein BDN70DRAFT_608595 [Pholiota conissans]